MTANKSYPAKPGEGSLSASPSSHPATAKAWAWFEEHQDEFSYPTRERILLALAELDAGLWKLDHTPSAKPLHPPANPSNRSR